MEKIVTGLLEQGYAATWLILAVVALRLVLRRAPGWTKYILWALVAVRLLCPFALRSVFSLIPDRTVPVERAVIEDAFFGDTAATESSVHVPPAVSDEKPTATGGGISGLDLCGWIWLGGMSVMLSYSVASYGKLRRRIRAAVPLEGNVWIGDEVDTPFVLGLLRPRIYLPSDMGQQEREYVLAHENMHLRHLDHWWKLAGFCLLTVYWFHPLVWLSHVLFCRDMELACDEQVICDYDMEQKKAYARALLACSVRPGGIAACPVAFGEVGVKIRVRAVLHYKKPGFWILTAALLLCLAVAVCFLTNPPRRLVLPEDPLVFQGDDSSGEYLAIVYGERYYVPYAAVGSSAVGDCIGYCDMVDGETAYRDYICTFPGYAPRDWVVSVMGLENCDEAMLYREIHVTELPPDIYNEYPWNEVSGQDAADPQTSEKTSEHGGAQTQETPEYIEGAEGHSQAADASVDMKIRQWGVYVEGGRLALEDVIRLSAKGWELDWADFDGYRYWDVGFGLYIRIYPVNEHLSLWVGGGSLEEIPLYIYLQDNATEARIDIREGDVAAFVAQYGGPESETPVRLPLAEGALEGDTVRLERTDAQAILKLVEEAQWQDGTTDCLGSYSLTMGENTLQYHADYGTFNDPAGSRHFTLDRDQREDVNIRLARYLRQAMPVESESKSVSR